MKIVTPVVNNPEFIEIQYHTFSKYIKGNFEFIVFNDAKDYNHLTNHGDTTIRKKIQDLCEKLSIKCINIPSSSNDISTSHQNVLNNHILKYQKENPDKYLLVDSDMFLIDYFDIEKYEIYECAIVLQYRPQGKYFWPGLCYMDFTKIKNTELLNWNGAPNMDTGGMMKLWLEKQYDIGNIQNNNNIYCITHLPGGNWDKSKLPEKYLNNTKLIDFLSNDVRNKNGKYDCELFDNGFLHYKGGSNWGRDGKNIHDTMTERLKTLLIT